jgi:hypothetical protein
MKPKRAVPTIPRAVILSVANADRIALISSPSKKIGRAETQRLAIAAINKR